VAAPPLTSDEIQHFLEEWLEVEFTFLHVDVLAASLVNLPRDEQDFLLGWVRRIATTNIEIAYQFARQVLSVLSHMDRHTIEAWALHAMDTYDRSGLRPALAVIHEVENFVQLRHERVAGALFEDVSGVLLTFVRGLSGRKLKLEQGDGVYTDSETLFLPAVVAQMESATDNFTLAKAMVAYLWAQTRFGSFRADMDFAGYPDASTALRYFHALETLRLEACLARELPGLSREMQRLKHLAGTPPLPEPWNQYAADLARPDATVQDTLRLLAQAYGGPVAGWKCYQGELRPDAIISCMKARIDKEKMLLRIKLAELAKDHHKADAEPSNEPPKFELQEKEDARTGQTQMELTLDDAPISPPEDVRQLITSIQLDFGEIPDEYLVAAGDGEYDSSLFEDKSKNPDDVWQGTYHEEGAFLYPEWDFGRQHYRKNWCVVREKDVQPSDPHFAAEVITRHTGLVKHLRRTFEVMRDENRMLKRQAYGDDVDIDALVEALADARDGREMTDRLFTRMHRTERNIAVMFMVDMSGSTKGWINDAEREALVMLCEALEMLGDRYAIYGFSGNTRKRCEIFKVKTFDDRYDEMVKRRIAGISPQDYTRMGPAIRHLSKLLNEVEAKTKLLVTLSDGKPDDYFDGYRGQYGIEDTRQALYEAHRSGIHPFCITIDREARDYLPHMYGAANYVVIDDVQKLPFKVADIYRRITT
jgi:nitric oxide reductase NorD protein